MCMCRMEWKETARWIKFEEDVEEGGNKWSKPHVATLSLHSLFELRSCIFRGTVMLDLQADNLATISGEGAWSKRPSTYQVKGCGRESRLQLGCETRGDTILMHSLPPVHMPCTCRLHAVHIQTWCWTTW